MNSTRSFAPVVAAVFVLAAAHWVVAEPASQGTQNPSVVTGTVSAPFEYFPAQFVNQGTESGEHIVSF